MLTCPPVSQPSRCAHNLTTYILDLTDPGEFGLWLRTRGRGGFDTFHTINSRSCPTTKAELTSTRRRSPPCLLSTHSLRSTASPSRCGSRIARRSSRSSRSTTRSSPTARADAIAADVLTAKAENGTALHGAPQPGDHRSTRPHLRAGRRDRRQAGARQHVRGKRSDGDKSYIAFTPPPAANTPKKPEFLPGAGEGTAPMKEQDAIRPQPRGPGRNRQPRTHHEDDVPRQGRSYASHTVKQQRRMSTGLDVNGG